MILEAKNLIKSFPPGDEKLKVLKGVNLNIAKGDIVSIMGPSGCGKSTLLNILGTIDKPDEGDVFINGNNVNMLSDDTISKLRNSTIGFIFQFHHLLPEFSVLENLLIPQMMYGTGLKEAVKWSCELLDIVGLADLKDRNTMEISGGERQRVAVARALVNKPKIVLGDEPTGNLDSETGLKIMDLIKGMRDQFGNSFIVATHNPIVAQRCDRNLIFNDGILVESGQMNVDS